MFEGTQRRLAAILAADVVDYTRLMAEDQQRTLEALRQLRGDLLEPSVARAGGQVIKRLGDGWMPLGSPNDKSKDEWQAELEFRLEEAQARLAAKAISRDATQFDVVLGGSAGVGGWYDMARRARALLTGNRFNPRHGKTPHRSGL